MIEFPVMVMILTAVVTLFIVAMMAIGDKLDKNE